MELLHSIADLLVKLSIVINNITPLLVALMAVPGSAALLRLAALKDQAARTLKVSMAVASSLKHSASS